MPSYEALVRLRIALAEDPDPNLVHLYPQYGKQHTMDGLTCWCGPKLDHADQRIVLHNPSH